MKNEKSSAHSLRGQGVLFEEGDDAEDEDGLGEDEHGGEGGADVREDDGGDTGGGGDEIEAQYRGASGHAAGDQAMGEVVGVADEWALAAGEADEGNDDEVIERQSEDDDGGEEGVPAVGDVQAGREVGGADGEDAENEADEQGAAVAHEDGRGGEI